MIVSHTDEDQRETLRNTNNNRQVSLFSSAVGGDESSDPFTTPEYTKRYDNLDAILNSTFSRNNSGFFIDDEDLPVFVFNKCLILNDQKDKIRSFNKDLANLRASN